MKTTLVFKRNLQAFNQKYRRIINKGGTSSSKTFSILQLLLCIAERRAKGSGVVISVVSESMPHLKAGAIKDFETILKADAKYDENQINFTDHIYYFGNSYIHFFSADRMSKATGPRRNILYLNEVNNIPYSVIDELEKRTDETIFYDFNPTEPFWLEEKVLILPDRERTVIKSNFYDNSELAPILRYELEKRAERDPNFKRIHIDCEYGTTEGLIYPNFTIVEDLPAVPGKFGLDFGFTNDPSTLQDVRYANGGLWARQLLYRTGMTNQEIGSFMKTDIRCQHIKRTPIIADSAEMKSIRELELMGFNVVPSQKGPDSVRQGIDKVKTYPLYVTKESLDYIKELRNYRWAVDRFNNIARDAQGKPYPIDGWNHLLDPLRYVVMAGVTRPHSNPRMTINRR